MLKSMTGFGRSDIREDGYSVQIQIKSVNHRYSDFTVKTPRLYSFLEDPIRSLASKEIARGKVLKNQRVPTQRSPLTDRLPRTI